MYSELEKWLTIRKMVEEKYLELKRAVEALTNNYSSYNMFIQKSKEDTKEYLKEICAHIKSRFLTPKISKEIKSDWISQLSAVDLLHLYSYLNDILRCFYHYVDIAVYDKTFEGDVLKNYRMRRCGEVANNAPQLFSRFFRSVKNFGRPNPNRPDEECYEIDKYFSKKDIEFSGKPEAKDEPQVDFSSLDFRKAVTALLVQDAVKRFMKKSREASLIKSAINEEHKKPEFNLVKKQFCLNSRAEDGFGIKNLPEPYSDEFLIRVEDDKTRELVGLDVFNRPIEKDRLGNLYDCSGQLLPDDTYFVPTDMLD